MAAPAARWAVGLALSPSEAATLKAGKRVTRTYPEPIPYGPPPLSPEDLDAMRAGKHVMKTFSPTRTLQVGDILGVIAYERPREPPPLRPEELEALLAGQTLTKTSAQASPPPTPLPDICVRVVDYKHQGHDHVYTFEAVYAER